MFAIFFVRKGEYRMKKMLIYVRNGIVEKIEYGLPGAKRNDPRKFYPVFLCDDDYEYNRILQFSRLPMQLNELEKWSEKCSSCNTCRYAVNNLEDFRSGTENVRWSCEHSLCVGEGTFTKLDCYYCIDEAMEKGIRHDSCPMDPDNWEIIEI